jgi:hypothetical protein
VKARSKTTRKRVDLRCAASGVRLALAFLESKSKRGACFGLASVKARSKTTSMRADLRGAASRVRLALAFLESKREAWRAAPQKLVSNF